MLFPFVFQGMVLVQRMVAWRAIFGFKGKVPE